MIVFGVDIGLLIGVVFSMITVILRTQHPRCEVMGSVGGTDIYRNCKSCVSVRRFVQHCTDVLGVKSLLLILVSTVIVFSGIV